MIGDDYSTIDGARLRELFPAQTIAPQHRLDRQLGSGCYGDPPGYPTYFLRHVYTKRGNEAKAGSSLVLMGREVENAQTWDGTARERLREVYRPLPIDHPRVALWIAHTLQHLRNCYIDDTKPERDGDRIVIYPVPNYKLPALRAFKDDPRFSDDWRDAQHAAIDAANVTIQAERYAIMEATQKMATVDNHAAVRKIREFYPDFVPTLEQITSPEIRFQEDWWERFAEQPSEDECPGHLGVRHVTGNDCRMCGRRAVTE